MEQGIRNAGLQVTYEVGSGWSGPPQPAMIDSAVASANASDVVVLVLGDDTSTCGEARDRDDLDLPGDPSHCAWGVERRAEISALGPLAGCFSALGSGLGLVGTASARR